MVLSVAGRHDAEAWAGTAAKMELREPAAVQLFLPTQPLGERMAGRQEPGPKEGVAVHGLLHLVRLVVVMVMVDSVGEGGTYATAGALRA